MIQLQRRNEPEHLEARRNEQLRDLGPTKPDRTKRHKAAYDSVKDVLRERQNGKCCYCERIVDLEYNDVEHFRPFSRYWWLAWTWANLLFACPRCNRSGKNDAFPLAPGSEELAYGESPPGREQPLLLDPSADDPRAHIRFVRVAGRWMPIGLDLRGRETLGILNFHDHDGYRDATTSHVNTIMAFIRVLRRELEYAKHLTHETWAQMLRTFLDQSQPFRALTEDVLRHEFPSYPAPPE